MSSLHPLRNVGNRDSTEDAIISTIPWVEWKLVCTRYSHIPASCTSLVLLFSPEEAELVIIILSCV